MSSGRKAAAVDLVTGKATQEYFFDPTLLIPEETDGKVPKNTTDRLFFDSKHLFMPCTIIKPLRDSDAVPTTPGKADPQMTTPIAAPTLVKTSDGALHKIHDSTKLVKVTDVEGLDDVLHLSDISEAALLHTLRLRYRRDAIYTAAGQILISVNPYRKMTNLYTEKTMTAYRNSGFRNMAPHLFLTADRAYTALTDSIRNRFHDDDEDDMDAKERILNQSIVISGESGAGKTEATKIILRYLAKITRKQTEEVAALEDRVLSSNPLLETFGNAQTLRNNNSSRFGKFIHIYFDANGSIAGASIANYLLEKTRITHQVQGERNYHVFYQLISGASEELLSELGLEIGIKGFRYLGNKGKATSDDKKAFAQTKDCLSSIGLNEEDQKSVFGMVAAVLHLGNIQFEANDNDVAAISESSKGSLKNACSLLGLNEDKLTEAVLNKQIIVNGKSILKSQTVDLAEDKRDALAKMTYACLFLWLVNKVNESFKIIEDATEDAKLGNISVLDIYGFESFEVNGFEQFLINYCNETLQRHFNKHLFETEQELYSTEGVDWSYISFNDNRPCLELIEGGGGCVGILNTLDEAWSGMGGVSEKDAQFAKQLHNKFGIGMSGDHPSFIKSKFGTDKDFTILHYAGAVRYTVDGFVEKNMETLSNELRYLGDSSSSQLAKNVYECAGIEGGSDAARATIRGVSVGSQFRTSLKSLVSDLERTQPHYIRCVKPNLAKSPNKFMSGEVLKQLRYSGMMEAIRIRQEGYALREEHNSFFEHYSVLLTAADIQNNSEDRIVHLVRVLSDRLGVSDADWQIGHSKIFLRHELSEKLERLARLRVQTAARCLTKFGSAVVLKRSALFLTVWARFRLQMLGKRKLRRASAKINALYRGTRQRRMYKASLKAIIRIQSEQRRIAAVHRRRKLEDPFYDMTFAECKRLLESEQLRLDKAVENQNFKVATDLSLKIETIKEAVEAKKPMTRSVVDGKISAVKAELEDAVKRKAFAECGPLQDKLDELTALQASLPTIEELKSAIKDAEAAMTLSAKNRDFAGAAAAQKQLDQSRQQLSEVLEAEEQVENEEQDRVESKCGYSSRADLESDIAALVAKLEGAVNAKNFAQASILQQKLDEKQALRELFPSVDEMKQKLAELRKQMQDALTAKDFEQAGKIDDNISKIEQKIEVEMEKQDTNRKSDNDDAKDDSDEVRSSVAHEARKTPPVRSKSVRSSGPASAKSTTPTKQNLSKPSVMSAQKFGTDASISAVSFQVRGSSSRASQKTVAALRPSKPVVVDCDRSILHIAKELVEKRSDCMLLTELGGGDLLGIVTSTDITRRLVSKGLSSSVTTGADIMTSNPTCVSINDSAMDALTLMIEHRFRHLPVVDGEGSIAGVVDVAKCLDAAITKLEDAQKKGTSTSNFVLQNLLTQKNVSGSDAQALSQLLATVMQEAFGGESSPTLRSLLAGKPMTITCPDASVYEASQLMMEHRKATLIVEHDRVVGIFGFKDMMKRVVAAELDVNTTEIAQVMTKAPECVDPDITVIEALQIMHDSRFLSLPVCESDGRVVGLVDVLDVMYGCGGTQGWRAIFASVLDGADENVSMTSESHTDLSSRRFVKPPLREKSVSKLRPQKPVIVDSSRNIASVAQLLKQKRSSASLVTNVEGALEGIITDTDITRRVVSKRIDPATNSIATVMTSNPTCVSVTDPATEALTTMIENHFRKFSWWGMLQRLTKGVLLLGHLPVTDDNGCVVGVLDIAKCLNDAITRLEHSLEKSNRSAEQTVGNLVNKVDNAQAAALQAMLGSLVAEAFGSKTVPTLRKILAGKPGTIVGPQTSIADAAILMAETRKAALIVEDGALIGIFGFKDMMTRVVAEGLNVEEVEIRDVMTRNPIAVSPESSVLDALETMHTERFLTLPVCEDNGNVVGVVDVMDVMYGCGGADGWRSIFSSAMDMDDGTASVGQRSTTKSTATSVFRKDRMAKPHPVAPYVSDLPGNIPSTLEFKDDDHVSFTGSTIGDERMASKPLLFTNQEDMSRFSTSTATGTAYKITCPNGSTHRIRCHPKIEDLFDAITEKSGIPRNRLRVEYEDDEGDIVVVTTDDDVLESWNLAKKAGKQLAKLTVLEQGTGFEQNPVVFIGAGVTVVALLGALAFTILRK